MLDKFKFYEIEGKINFALGHLDKATTAYETLLQYNSANWDTYKRLLECKGVNIEKEALSDEDQAKVYETMNYYRERLPRVNAHLRVGLKYLSGGKFVEYLRLYVKPLLIKGAPSVMTDLKEFYVDVTKRQQIQDLLEGWLSNMRSEMVLDTDEEVEQDPTVMVWLLYFLS